jgi:hypothetical protein
MLLAEVLQQVAYKTAVMFGQAEDSADTGDVSLFALLEALAETPAQPRRVRRHLPKAITLPNAQGLNVKDALIKSDLFQSK